MWTFNDAFLKPDRRPRTPGASQSAWPDPPGTPVDGEAIISSLEARPGGGCPEDTSRLVDYNTAINCLNNHYWHSADSVVTGFSLSLTAFMSDSC